ncbi:MAG: hypothetical protein RL198_772 [Actinomycetota bacterium]
MIQIRSVSVSLLALTALLVGQPTPVPAEGRPLTEQSPAPAVTTVALSGIDWSQVEPSFADLSGVFDLPRDRADAWLEPERFTDCLKVSCIALTFDDGPLPGHTDRLLEILAEHEVSATFFVVGRMVNNYPELLQAAIAAGHEIAGHSYSHARLTELGSESLHRDFERTNQAIKDVSGDYPSYFRPPYGMHNQRVRDAAQQPTVMWSIDPQDWRKANSASDLARYVLARAHPGAIVLMHDSHAKTATALPEIILGLREQGYELVTVAEILGPSLNPQAVYRSGLTPPPSDPAAE